MSNQTSKKLFKFILLFLIYFSLPTISFAETHIYSDIGSDFIWDKNGSPYILEEPVYIPHGEKLKIEKGVEVISTVSDDGPFSLNFDGDLDVNGTKEEPVKFTSLYSLYFSNSSSSIKNALFDGTGLDFFKSSTTIEHVTIKNAFNAISAKASHIDISSSIIKDSSYGISSYMHQQFFQARSDQKNNEQTGGIGNAVIGTDPLDSKQNIISIHDSSILNNNYHGIFNQTFNYIDASDNWWGRSDGPTPVDINGLVYVDPWKLKDPNIAEIICCSNVLFIPGIEASRLYKDEKTLLGTSTNKLWEPISNNDVKKMYMDSKGKSLDSTIYTKDVIDLIPGIEKIYKSFIDNMDSLVLNGEIKKWLPLPYDWRNGVYDIVTDKVLQNVYDLASSSKTGKIIIISHSNGGLVAKALMKKLEQKGKADIVDNLIFIAVPELGTPEALLSMLHGYNQSIAGGLVLTKNNARTFSQNMPGAYGLLPSRKFFEKNPITVISNLFSGNFLVIRFDNMKKFLLNNPFSQLASSDTNIPLLLNSYLIDLNDSFHLSLDNWKPASSTKTLSIFGWGVPTSQGISYSKDPHCDKNKNQTCSPIFSSVLNEAGDGTVLTKSNSGNSSSTLFFNLKKLQHDNLLVTNHANILESGDLIQKLNDIITNKKTPVDNPPHYEKYFSETEPVDTDKHLIIKIFSPVDIDVYDKDGNHTGPVSTPVKGQMYENNIIGGYYADFGGVKMVRIPYDTDNQIVLSGNDTGVFIVQTEVTQFNQVIASTSFAELPVTPSTNIDFIVGSTSESFASSSYMNIDIDGDGSTDIISHSDTYIKSTSTLPIKDFPTYIESIRKTILALGLSPLEEKTWLNRIDNISRILEKKNHGKIEKIIKKLSNKRFKHRKLSEKQKSAILTVFKDLLAQLEEE